MGGIAAIDSLRKQLEDKQVDALRWETRCNTVTQTVTNMEKLLADIHATIRRLDEELQNVHKWNNFYDGNLENAHRTLSMLKDDRDKKRRQFDEDSERMRKHLSQKQKECELRKEQLERNIELVWKKIPAYALKLKKEETIKSLTEQLNQMGIQNGGANANRIELSEKLKNLNIQKTESMSVLKQKKLEYDNLGKKIIEQKMINTSKNDEVLKLRNTLNQIQKELNLLENAKDKKTSSCESSLPDGESDQSHQIKPAENLNVSVHDQSLDNTMFEEMESRNEAEVLKTPSKKLNATLPGPMHSTPHHFTTKLSGFIRPQQSKHCSAPPNVTPINSSMLSKSSSFITPMNTLSKLAPRNNGAIQGLRNSTPLINTIVTANKSEITPTKSNFMLSLPKTPISSLNKGNGVESKTFTNEYAMDKGLLAPTPEKENALSVTPTKNLVSMPVAPSAPVKAPQDPQYSSANPQPDSKKLKPSNSFTKVVRPMSPRSTKVPQPDAPSHETKQSGPKPNERGDVTVFSSALTPDDASIKTNPVQQISNQKDNQGAIATINAQKEDTSKEGSPFGFGFGGDSPIGFGTSESAFGDSGFSSGSAFGDGSQFTTSTEFDVGSGFGESNFGASSSGFGAADDTSSGFGAAGDSAGFGSGFGGFNF